MEYRIGRRVRTNFLDRSGLSVDGYRVYYEMSDGMTDYVEIPKAQFSAGVVKEAIEEQIKAHEEIVA